MDRIKHMGNTEGKNENQNSANFADEKEYYSFIFGVYFICLATSVALFILAIKIINVEVLLRAERYYIYLWPQNIYIKKTIGLGNFSDSDKVSFFLSNSIMSLLLLSWMVFSIFWRIRTRKHIYIGKIFTATFVIALSAIVISIFPFTSSNGLHDLSFSQPMFFNIMKYSISVAVFYLSAQLCLYSLISAIKHS